VDAYPRHIKNQTTRTYFPKKKIALNTKLVYLGLGSNIGNSIKHLEKAIEKIASNNTIEIVKIARFYKTKAWGNTEQQDFVNTAISIKTILEPQQLLKALQAIEIELGRVKIEKWGPRIIDIDILLYGNRVVNQQQLQIPHPYITQRSFVLAPLHELNAKIKIPNKGYMAEYMDWDQINEEIIEVL
jgi:2-amino-4-hydroxy-6-hydroxymethyldihydropteridine diphosphokinase